MRPAQLLFVFLFCLVGTGCSKVPLYSGLAENDANDMMAILLKENISCVKKAAEEGRWSLSVPVSDFSKSVESLHSVGYPKEHFAGIGESFKKSGLVSSPTEERIRFMHALSQELAQTISGIDGVLMARVHVVLPDNNPFGEETRPSSAAVFIKHRPEAIVEAIEPSIKRLVMTSIESRKEENVSIVAVPAQELSVESNATSLEWKERLDIRIAPESEGRFWLLFGGLAAIAVINLVLAAVAVVRWRTLAATMRKGVSSP